MKKAQVAYEFMMVFLMLSFGFTIWIVYASSLQEDFQRTKNLQDIEDFSLSLKHELYVVAQMNDGFSRTINLPQRVAGYEYDIEVKTDIATMNENEINLSTVYINCTALGYYTHFDAPLIEGTLTKGKNILKKTKQEIITQP